MCLTQEKKKNTYKCRKTQQYAEQVKKGIKPYTVRVPPPGEGTPWTWGHLCQQQEQHRVVPAFLHSQGQGQQQHSLTRGYGICQQAPGLGHSSRHTPVVHEEATPRMHSSRGSCSASPSLDIFPPCAVRITFNNWCQSLHLKLSDKKSTAKGSVLRKEITKAPFKVKNAIPKQVGRAPRFVRWAGGIWDT